MITAATRAKMEEVKRALRAKRLAERQAEISKARAEALPAREAQRKAATAAERAPEARGEAMAAELESEGAAKGWKRCGFTFRRCPMAKDCTWNTEEIKHAERTDGRRPAKIEACALAVERGFASCGPCPDRKRCAEAWRCFKVKGQNPKAANRPNGRTKAEEA